MKDSTSRFIQMDNWIFEVKSVRAIRVNSYGEPYDAIANLSFNGDNAYIDGLMTREEKEFSKKDYQIFCTFCQKLGIRQIQFDRFKANQFKLDTIDLAPIKEEAPKFSLVR